MPVSNTSSTSTSAPCVHQDDSHLNTAASPQGLYQLALHGEPDAFRSALDRLLALARRGELSPDQLLAALMNNSGHGQTALHSGFNPTRLDKLTLLLDAVERAADEGLLQGRHVASLILKQDTCGQAALHLFADSGGANGENLSRLCQWMLRLVGQKVLTPSDAKAILSQKSPHGSAFCAPMVRGSAVQAEPSTALHELFKFSTALVNMGAVTGDFVLSTLDKKGLRTIFGEARNPQIKATIDGIDQLLATGTLRRQTLMNVALETMQDAGDACLDDADSLEEMASALPCKAMVIDAWKRWFSDQPDALPRQGAAHTAPPPTA